MTPLLDGDIRAVRLADPDAGRVDDLVLIGRDRTDGYQFKSVEYDSYLTFRQLVRPQRTRSGAKGPIDNSVPRRGLDTPAGAVGATLRFISSPNSSHPSTIISAMHDTARLRITSVRFSPQCSHPLRRNELALDHAPAEWRPGTFEASRSERGGE